MGQFDILRIRADWNRYKKFLRRWKSKLDKLDVEIAIEDAFCADWGRGVFIPRFGTNSKIFRNFANISKKYRNCVSKIKVVIVIKKEKTGKIIDTKIMVSFVYGKELMSLQLDVPDSLRGKNIWPSDNTPHEQKKEAFCPMAIYIKQKIGPLLANHIEQKNEY
jgi:hypothetical protein